MEQMSAVFNQVFDGWRSFFENATVMENPDVLSTPQPQNI